MDRGESTAPHIAVVGGGQSARWLLFALAEQLARGVLHGARITVIEGRNEFGTGLAWSRRFALEEHLASLPTRMTRWSYGDRQQQQFLGTAELLRESGVLVSLLRGQEAVLIRPARGGLEVGLGSGATVGAEFVVLATGYGQSPPSGGALRGPAFDGHIGVHRSPWPAKALQDAIFDGDAPQRRRVLILGSYLNAIDAALSLALKAGNFRSNTDGRLEFSAPREVTMVMGSRSGQLPRVWGHEPIAPHRPRWFCEERLHASLQTSEHGRFLPIHQALRLLSNEVLSAWRGREAPEGTSDSDVRRRVRGWRRQLAAVDVASSLRRDIVAASEANSCRWQAVLDGAIQLWSEFSPALSAEDQLFFDRELRTPFFNHLLPMTLQNALQLEALMSARRLHVIALGRDYQLRPSGGVDRFELSYLDASGQAQRSTFSDVIDATGHSRDINRDPAPLVQGMLRDGIIQPALRAFRRVSPSTDALASEHSVVARGGRAYLSAGGVFVNPHTCEVIPRDHYDIAYSGSDRGGVYAMGPSLVGQFVDAQSLGQTQRDARRIALDICRKLTVFRGEHLERRSS